MALPGDEERQPLLTSSPTAHTSTVRSTPRFGLSDELYGYVLMAVSTVGFSAMTFLVHLLSNPALGFGLPSSYVVWFRSVVQVVGAAVYVIVCVDAKTVLGSVTKHQFRTIVARGVVGAGGFICLFKALSLIPLGDAVCIFFLSPMMTMLMSHAVLGEPISAVEAAAALVSFAGVVLVAKPSALDPSAPAVQFALASPADRVLGVSYALCAAFLGAVAYTLVRSLGTSVHFILNVASLGIVATIVTTLAIGPSLLSHIADSLARPRALGLLVAQGLGALLGQLALNLALQFCSGVGVMIRNLDVPIAYLLGVVLLGEVPSRASSVGALLVLASVGAISWRQAVRSR
jgi:drug/metabolite transporter (DMT)-like permease